MYYGLFIHSPIEYHICVQVLAVIGKASLNLCVGLCVGMIFQLIWVNRKQCNFWMVW